MWIENREWPLAAKFPNNIKIKEGEKIFLRCNELDNKRTIITLFHK